MNLKNSKSITSLEDSNQMMVTGTVEALAEGCAADKDSFRLTTSEGQNFNLIASSEILDMESIRGRKVCVLSTLCEHGQLPTLTVLGYRIITPDVFDFDTGVSRRS